MPTFLLCLKADLENVGKLNVSPGHRYCIDVQESAGAEQRKGVYVTAAELHDLTGSKGSANFVMKWSKDARHEAYINVIEMKGVIRAITADDDGKFVPVAAFECRGVDPIAFYPQDGFLVESAGGKKFDDVDLEEKEWCDFDEKADCPVGIYEVEAKFERHKGK